MVAHRTPKNEPHARTSRTLFRKDFARTRTRATAHRTCVCAHAPSQLIPWILGAHFVNDIKIKSHLGNLKTNYGNKNWC